MTIRLLAGRLLSEQRGADGVMPDQLQGKSVQPLNVLINATAARRMGYSPQAAIGKTLTMDVMGGANVTIVGVVADIKEDGRKNPVDGTMYMYWRSFPLGHLSVRLREGAFPRPGRHRPHLACLCAQRRHSAAFPG